MTQRYEITVPWNNRDEMRALAMINHPKAVAQMWIEAYADGLSGYEYGEPEDEYEDEDSSYYYVSATELIDTALHNLNNSGGWNDYISKGGMLEGVGVDSTFWDKLAILCDVEIPSNKRESFFSCSC